MSNENDNKRIFSWIAEHRQSVTSFSNVFLTGGASRALKIENLDLHGLAGGR